MNMHLTIKRRSSFRFEDPPQLFGQQAKEHCMNQVEMEYQYSEQTTDGIVPRIGLRCKVQDTEKY
jgi:hypothetical protein